MEAASMTLGQLKSRRNLYLVFATLTLLVLGLIYAWSIFAAPIGATYTSYQPMLPQVFQVSMFAFCLSGLVGSQIVKRVSAKAAIVLAAVLMAVGFVLTALFAGTSIWALFIFYGLFAGSGCGIAYNAIISLVNPWFPDRIGFCSGVMMMGFGVSSLVFGSLANALFDVIEWPRVFIGIAMAAFIIMFLLAFIVKPAPQGFAAQLGLSGAATAEDTPTQKQSVFKTASFWPFWLWSTLIVACGLTLIGTASQGLSALDSTGDDFFAGYGALLVGLVSTMNGISRIINGAVFDKVGLIPVMRLAAIVAVLCMAGLSLAFAFNISLLYIVAAICIAFSYAACPVMGSAFARQRFGAQSFSVNLGIINCNIAIAAAINIILVALLGSPAGGNGALIYGVYAVFALVSFVASFLFAGSYKKELKHIEAERKER